MNIMAVTPYISFLRPKIRLWNLQTCGLRTSLKIRKDIYELAIDVRHFCKDDLKVKVRQDRILIEGKHERKLDEGVIYRAFLRKYMLPSGIDPKKIQSELTNDGILTIRAPRDSKHDTNKELCEMQVPIKIKGIADAQAKVKELGDDIKDTAVNPKDKS